jgi:hypothetical protein
VRFLGRFLIFIVVMTGLLAGLDVAVRIFVEGQIAQEVEDSPQLDVADVDASIDSFPFLGKLLTNGEISSFTIQLDDIADPRLTIKQLSITGDGITLDRDDLMQGTARVTDVQSATARLTITQEAASAALGVEVVFVPGAISVNTAAGPVSTSVEVVNGVVSFVAPGVGTLNLELPLQQYLPCPPSARAEAGQIVLSCTADELPPIVLDALGPQTINS